MAKKKDILQQIIDAVKPTKLKPKTIKSLKGIKKNYLQDILNAFGGK